MIATIYLTFIVESSFFILFTTIIRLRNYYQIINIPAQSIPSTKKPHHRGEVLDYISAEG